MDAVTTRTRETGDMLSQLERHEIQVLLGAGFGPQEVADRAGVSQHTVRTCALRTAGPSAFTPSPRASSTRASCW